MKRTAVHLLLVVLGILAGNSPQVLGLVDPDPLLSRSWLAEAEEQPWLPGEYTADPNDGFTTHALGYHAADEWKNGRIPYWDHHQGLGAPLAGGMQAAAMFPPVLLLRLPGGLVPFRLVLEITAAIGTYLFLRRLKLGPTAAIVGAIAYGLCGTYAWLANAVVNPVAFLPWLALGVELAVTAGDSSRDRRLGRALIALALALSLYSGFPETAFIYSFLAYGWGVLRWWTRGEDRARGARDVVTGTVTGLLLAAPIVIAFVGYLPDADTGGHGAGAFAGTFLPRVGIPTVVIPYVFGPLHGFTPYGGGVELGPFWGTVGGYLGMAVVALAALGLGSATNRRTKVFFMVFGAACLAKVFGVPGFSQVIGLIPGMSQIAFERYSIPSITFCVVVAAAFGLDDLIDGRVPRRHVAVATVAGLVLVVLLAWQARGLVSRLTGAPDRLTWAVASVALAGGVVVLLGAGSLLRTPRARAVVLASVATVEVVALFIVPQLSARRVQKIDTGVVSYLRENLGTGAYVTLGPLQPNYGSYYRLRSVNTNNIPLPRAYSEAVAERLNGNVFPLAFAGFNQSDPKGPSTLDEVYRNLDDYQDLGVRYLLAVRNTVDPKEAAARGLRLATTTMTVDVFELPDPRPYFETPPDAGCRIDTRSFDEAAVTCERATRLVRRTLPMPGWSAEVDDAEAEVRPEGALFQRIDVPAGRSEIRFTYAPPFITIGWIMFVLGALVLLAQIPAVARRMDGLVRRRRN